jgi:hypothetical protein
VKSGAATWEGLEAAGLALAPQKAGAMWMQGFRIKASPVITEGPTP